MRHSLFMRLFILIQFTFLLSSNTLAAQEQVLNTPKNYINLAISKQKTDPSAAYKALDTAYALAQKQHNVPLVARVLLEQAQTAKIQKNYLLAQQYLLEAEELIPTLNDNDLLVRILINMSVIQRFLKNYDTSMEYIQEALTIAQENRETALIFKYLKIKGALLQKTQRYKDSVTTYLSAQRYMQSADNESQVELLRDTANAYNKVNEPFSSIRYYKKSLKLIENSSHTEEVPNILIELAKTQAKIGEFSQALKNSKLALTLAREYKNEEHILKSLVVLSVVYRKISNYEEALSHGLEAIKIYQKNEDFDGFASAANSIGLIYIHLNQADNAKNYFYQVTQLDPKSINSKYRAAALRGLGKLIFAETKTVKA